MKNEAKLPYSALTAPSGGGYTNTQNINKLKCGARQQASLHHHHVVVRSDTLSKLLLINNNNNNE
jgi:hypothetical protein